MLNNKSIFTLVLFSLMTFSALAENKFIEWEMLISESKKLYLDENYEKAQIPAEEALTIAKENFKSDNEKLSTSLNNLAVIYKKQEKYSSAEKLYKESLETMIPSSLETGMALNNLGELYKEQGDIEKAEDFFNRALDIKEKSVGKDDPTIATSLTSLAIIYDEYKKDYDRAEDHYKRAVDILYNAVKSNNADMSDKYHLDAALQNLKDFYINTGKNDKAENLEDQYPQI